MGAHVIENTKLAQPPPAIPCWTESVLGFGRGHAGSCPLHGGGARGHVTRETALHKTKGTF
eukprot:2467735-Prymnesium_polylepis.1